MNDSPFDRLDAEAARLDRHFASLAKDQWGLESRCRGWDRTAILAHLIGIEEYIKAGLDDRVAQYVSELGHVSGYEELNEMVVARLLRTPVDELLARWRELVATGHRRLRRRGADADIDTHAGPYPLGRQTWYFATELAIHADDVAAEVSSDEAADRLAWRLEFALDVLAEYGTNVQVTRHGDDFEVSNRAGQVRLSGRELVEATAGRLADEPHMPAELHESLVVLA